MPGRTSRTSLPPTPRSKSPDHATRKRRLPAAISPAAASPEPMTPRSSDDDADRPRFVAPADRVKTHESSAKPKPRGG